MTCPIIAMRSPLACCGGECRSTPVAELREAAIGLMSQQCRDLLECVPLCRLLTVEGLRDDRLFLCLVCDPAFDGCAHNPARFGCPSIGQPHMASRDDHLLDVACRAEVLPHRSLFRGRLVLIRPFRRFDWLRGCCFWINGHLWIDHRRSHD